MTTRRTSEAAPGRLFPSIEWDHGWSLSLQADKRGYHCAPRETLDTLEEYEAVEAKIDGPEGLLVDPTTLGLPEALARKFTKVAPDTPSLGRYLTHADIDVLKDAIVRASLSPNAGVPRGAVGWAGVTVYHGCSSDHAADIVENGVLMERSSRGYFGQAFYVADDKALAVSNYAEIADEGEGCAVLEFTIAEGARVLDLRNALDAETWSASGLERFLGRDDLAARARRAGIDAVYDRSVGGLAIYNPSVVGMPTQVEYMGGTADEPPLPKP